MALQQHIIQGKCVLYGDRMNFSARAFRGRELSLFSLFIISAVVSMLLIMFYKSEWLLQTEVLSEASLSLIKYQNSSNGSLFLFICKERLWVIPVLFLLSTTYLAPGVVYGAVVWYGTGVGSLLAVALMRYGMSGIFLLLGAAVPQFLFYIPAVVITLMISAEKRIPDKRFWVQLLILEVVVIMGCFMEGYVNLFLLEKIVRLLRLD